MHRPKMDVCWKEDYFDDKNDEGRKVGNNSTAEIEPADARKKCNHEKMFFDEPLETMYQPQFFNYQLIGDMVAAMISGAYDLLCYREFYEPPPAGVLCNFAWSVYDILHELERREKRYPIAKTVILAVGYNDYQNNSMPADTLVEGIEKLILKLREKNCVDIIMANVPPCALDYDRVNHWKYLQMLNEEILRLSKKYSFVCHCDVFKLFCSPKNYFSQCKDYVTFEEINYEVDFPMYNAVDMWHKIDLITFSDSGKKAIGKQLIKTIENRQQYLRYGKIDNVLCVVTLPTDDESELENVQVDETVEKMKDEKIDQNIPVISLDSSEEDDAAEFSHRFGCTCKKCREDDR